MQPGAYTASDKFPAPEKVPAIRDYILSAHIYIYIYIYIYTAEDRGFLDAPVQYTCACGYHARIHDYNEETRCECMTNYGFAHVNFIRNVAHVRFFSSRTGEFLN